MFSKGLWKSAQHALLPGGRPGPGNQLPALAVTLQPLETFPRKPVERTGARTARKLLLSIMAAIGLVSAELTTRGLLRTPWRCSELQPLRIGPAIRPEPWEPMQGRQPWATGPQLFQLRFALFSCMPLGVRQFAPIVALICLS